ncbi:alpha/beta hydrolase [Streptomyces sp. ISL-11]|uniref:alpha/beta hydrolase n=1 Tax=Streptomyces sp. ISL-11 TaxID=2819174 RepID=UPI001BEC1BC7|nr:alpha/beta fold hydrolase [Streptomyces sp. ISL-11]MBT2382428.1 alpha/beta fold hydrolase [Streptomyces sp. ISL-11]
MAFGGADDFARACVSSITSSGRRQALLTADGVRIEAAYEPYEGPATGGAPPPAVVLAHGFTGALDRPGLRRAARVFAQRAAVITFSFRGHGRSGGRSTVGDREVLDLAVAVAWARSLGHERVATVGFSMGGSVVLRHGALYLPGEGGEHGGRTAAHADLVVSVSAPARWYYRGTAPMRRLHWAISRPSGRAIARFGLRTRVHSEDWDPVPLSPTEAVPLIAPRPLLVVHGDRDAYFPLDHPRMLVAAAPGAVELWIERGFGHAENSAGVELLGRVAEWVSSNAGRAGLDAPGRGGACPQSPDGLD